MADPCAVIYRLMGHYCYKAQVASQSDDGSCAVIGRGGRWPIHVPLFTVSWDITAIRPR